MLRLLFMEFILVIKCKNKISIVLIAILIPLFSIAESIEKDSVFASYEKELSTKAIEISKIRFNEKLADSLSNSLATYFNEILEMDGAINYPFDSITSIGKVQTENGKLRIFTWNMVRDNGTYTYFGLLQVELKEQKDVKTYRLFDKSDSIINPESSFLTNANWFGALYYEIIESKFIDGNLYTLLGWDGNDLYTNKTIIESLTITQNGEPKFGAYVFNIDKKKQRRVIFEYSRMANMMVHYDSELDMIVYDHLAPSNPVYEGNNAYYGPDFSFDGFQFENNVWNHVSDVNYESIRSKNVKKNFKKRKR